MELRHLQTFATVVELESFTGAARALCITQSAVSHHIAALQHELRVALFRRAGRRMLPTEAGRLMYGYARRMLDLLSEARQAVEGTEAAITGTLRIAACSVAAETVVPRALARFREVCPRVKEELTICASRHAIRAVEAGTVDLAIVVELPESRELTATPIGSDELVLAVPAAHRLASGTSVAASALRGETLIGREAGSVTRGFVERALREAGETAADVSVTIEMSSDDAILAAVENGLGIGFLPHGAIHDALAAGRIVAVRVADLPLQFQLHLVTNPNRPLSLAATRCVQLLRGV
jgi:DNA-binding transcriptional LysR family regulator